MEDHKRFTEDSGGCWSAQSTIFCCIKLSDRLDDPGFKSR